MSDATRYRGCATLTQAVEVDGRQHVKHRKASNRVFDVPALEGSAALTAVVLAYWMGARAASVSPWYLNTVGYVLMGAAMTGMYDIAFSCTSLAPRRRFGSVELSRVIGQASLLLLLRPLQSLHVVTLPEKGVGLFWVWVSKVQRSFSFSALCGSAQQVCMYGQHVWPPTTAQWPPWLFTWAHGRPSQPLPSVRMRSHGPRSPPDAPRAAPPVWLQADGLRAPSVRIAAQFAAVTIFAAVFFPTMVHRLVRNITHQPPPTPSDGSPVYGVWGCGCMPEQSMTAAAGVGRAGAAWCGSGSYHISSCTFRWARFIRFVPTPSLSS